MDRFELLQLNAGEKLLVKTETGSIYHLRAETAPQALDESSLIFRGLRATRESDHNIVGRPEAIEDEPTLLVTRSADSGGTLRAGDTMELVWDSDHPESRSWDRQFGPKFHHLYTSRIIGIELVPVEE